ncbi:structural maintenance of chromosomes protein 6 [Volvox carteri f. nagariensis]|uniref:Structural maintenance of chromosomes protein 6 n=1 Tax=Volvox carteri f. nagariensis TaxID=3068 RepID=D8U4A0_VOLCA|nr:structural maintenance of chromosomes protein 6 [Volvox carteri f. nagariensis]EFJ45367.1 structural maintenance of chromosomes protein 6 [Volvox carteri f. nagariensis]|eukprot:XP_002953394.1 structural maintenance of chromosomes protein 6 [Volvox carteri f. nagariensis]
MDPEQPPTSGSAQIVPVSAFPRVGYFHAFRIAALPFPEKPAARHAWRSQPAGLQTPMSEDPGTPDIGTAGQQPRVQRPGRARKRNLDEGSGDAEGSAPSGPGGGEFVSEGAGAGGDNAGAEATERPKKRRAVLDPVPEVPEDDGQQEVPRAPMAHEDDDLSGFTARAVGLAGQIAKIRVENFMCHKHFEMEFGPHVTLVSGQNGSGKSAVVQALQVCLGVSARNTGRGTAIAELINAKAHDAKVHVTLWNTGDDAFMPSLFGDRVTIERHLKRVGASTYALLDSRGRKVTLDRGEKVKDVLDRMLEHFTVDANNALTIITQDKSRSLLSDKSNAKDKYEMFMAGTLLDRDDLKVANAQVAAMMKNLGETAARYNAEKQEENQLSSKVQKLRSADKFLEDREMLERAIVWRAVEQTEERVAAAKTAADARGPELVSIYERHIEAMARAKSEMQNRQQELANELGRHTEAMENHDAHIHALIRAEKDSRVNADRARRSKLSAQRTLETLVNDKSALDEQLAKDTNGKAAEARRLVEEHQMQVTAKQAALHEANEALTAARQSLEAARAEAEKLIHEEAAARDNVNGTARKVTDLQKALRELGAGQDNRLGMFKAVALNDMINQNVRRFRQRPIGPIGALLTVTDQKWLLATEVALGNAFRDYLVCCSEDAILLRELMKRVDYKGASVVAMPFNAPMHNIPPSRRPVNGFVPLLDVLIVHDAAARVPVMNYLVDKFRIESAALVNGHQEGESVNHGCAAGQHIVSAFDADGNWYRRNGDFRWIDRNRGVTLRQCRLVADVSQYKAALERDLEQTEAQLGAHQEDLTRLRNLLREARAWEAKCLAEDKSANALKARANTELRRLIAQAPEMPRFEDDEEAGTVLTQLASIQQELVGSQLQLQTADEALALAEQALQQAREEKERHLQRMEDGKRLRHQLDEVADKLKEIEAKRSTAEESRSQVCSQLGKLRERVVVAEERLQRALQAADQVCSRAEGQQAIRLVRESITAAVEKKLTSKQQRDRQLANMAPEELQRMLKRTVEASMDYATLEKQLATVNANIAKAAAEAGSSDLQELEIRLAAQSKTVATRYRAYKRMEEMVQRFQTSYANQMQSFERLRTSLMDITQAKFAKYLRRRDHDGRLEFNHAERTLKLLIKPKGKNNREAQAVEDLKQLSGGERSFTTVALLLAIGENTESPFRCNDEFDVYMDDINRRVATETLLEFAMEHPTFQYIFLTPQDIHMVEDARQNIVKRRQIQLPATFLRTVKMHPPREGATQA